MPNWQDALKIVLYDHLQTALVLEAYTIPMYLTAAYSIQDTNSEARKRIISQPGRSLCPLLSSNFISNVEIAKDEMFHLGLAGNMLCGIGGKPNLYNLTPEFPSTLFSTSLTLTLAPATKQTIQLFVDVSGSLPYISISRLRLLPQIEAPMTDEQNFGIEVLPTYKSIGEFYEGLQIRTFPTALSP